MKLIVIGWDAAQVEAPARRKRRYLGLLKLEADEHMHRCACGHTWKHAARGFFWSLMNEAEHDAMHTCACCGKEQTLMLKLAERCHYASGPWVPLP